MKAAMSILIGFLGVWQSVALAEPNAEIDAGVVRGACRIMLERHVRQHVDQRQLSIIWARQFLLAVDPRRMHFLASDVDEFMKGAPQLLAKAQDGDVDFAVLVADRFRTRLAANSSLISKLVAAEHDFTIDEAVQTEYETYSATQTDCDERWRLRIKYELMLERANGSGGEAPREFLRGRYSRIQKHFDSLGQSKILSLYVDSLARSFDSQSAYLDEDYLTMYQTSHIPNYTVGLRLTYRDGDLWIRPTAHDAGSRGQYLAGCRIVAVRLKEEEPIHLSGLTNGVAMRTILSPVGELGHAESVILEVDDPTRGKRRTLAADRWLPRP